MASSENVALGDITPEQSRAARALLDWSRDQLADLAGIPKRTIMRFEGREVAPRGTTLAAIRTALEAAGVEFIPENGGGAGVRLRKTGAAAEPTVPEVRSVGPEDEARGGHEAPGGPGPTVLEPGPKRRGRS